MVQIPRKEAAIFVFGDSICAGAVDTKGGWVVRLQKYLIENDMIDYSTYLYNLGVDAHTSEDILARFENETRSRLPHQEERKVFIFAFGINDSCFFKYGHSLVDKERFKQNTRKIIMSQHKFGGDVFFVGLTPVYEKKTNPLAPMPTVANTPAAAYQRKETRAKLASRESASASPVTRP